MAALIKNSHTRHLLVLCGHKLHSPEYLIEELENNVDEILHKTELSKSMLIELFRQVIASAKVNIVPSEEYDAEMQAAKEVSPDINDAPYFALALKLGCPIWSNDKKLKEQDRVTVYSTEELTV